MDRIIAEFKNRTPIKEIVKKLGMSEVKVRRVLITEGLWRSVTSDEIIKLVNEEFSTAEIADKLQKPVKTVQAYMPYSRGEYGQTQTYNAEQSKKFRERNKEFAKKQPVRSGVREMKSIDMWKEKEGYSGDGHKVLKLHLELIADIDDREEEILKKYGKVQREISRDILVPAEMRLHNLHYAIQKAFGWQNSHLHNFAYPDDVFSQLTDNKLTKWLKRKYTGPYYYGGSCEHYLYAATQAKAFKQQNPMLRIGPSFEEFMAGKKGDRIVKIDNVTMEESKMIFEFGMNELLERLPIGEVLATSADEAWKFKTEKVIHDMNESFSDNYKKMRTLSDDHDIERFYKKTNPKVIPLSDRLIYSYDYGDGWQIEITCVDEFESFDRWNQPTESGWTLAAITEKDMAKDQHPVDKNGNEIDGELCDKIINVIVKQKPVCVSMD